MKQKTERHKLLSAQGMSAKFFPFAAIVADIPRTDKSLWRSVFCYENRQMG